MAEIGAAVGTAVISAIAEKLTSFAVGEAVKEANSLSHDDLVKELKSLELNLNLIKDLLDDAKSKQNKSEGVRAWLQELKDAAYDAEDVLDEYATDLAILQQSKKPVSKWIKEKRVKSIYGKKITSISERFDVLKKKMNDFNLRMFEMSDKEKQHNARGEMTAFVDAGWPLIGRDIHIKKIIDMLISDESENNSRKLHVISIIGMGGVGKTSLVQFVYNDNVVKEHFPVMIWVWVSQNFDTKNILRSIISDIEGTTCTLDSLENLHTKVIRLIESKKFLLILDDAWNENECHWYELFFPLKHGERGSRVIVTTRSSNVARSIKEHVQHIYLEGLDEEHMFSILKRCAFERDVNDDEHGNLLRIGKDIIKELKGSPLAAKTIGRLLGTKLDQNHWMSILRSDLWEVRGQQEHDIIPSLWLSYQYLTPKLKFCFSLCSLFPKGYQISKEDLSYLWIAHGIFEVGHGMRPEVSALEAIQDLRSRFLLFQDKDDGFLTMHDLIHDVSEFVAQEDHLHIADKFKLEKLPNKLRHLSFSSVQWESKFPYDKLRSVRCTRKISYNRQLYNLDHRVLDSWLNETTCLRFLNLQGCRIGVLPKSIGNLKHLRCLNLSHTDVSELPKSLTSLYNLQALWLEFCFSLQKLPDGMGNLVNLSLLRADDRVIHTIKGIRGLSSLQELRYFNVDPKYGWGIEELEKLDMLGGDLTIRCLENVVDPVNARKACLERKKYLQGLTLQWSENNNANDQIAKKILENLQPNGDGLKSLEIRNYKGRVLPRWLTAEHFPSLMQLRLVNWENCKDVGLILSKINSNKSLHLQLIGSPASIAIDYTSSRLEGPIEILENMDMLHGELMISSLENVEHSVKAGKASLKQKKNLQGLTLEWSENNNVDNRIAEEILEALQPNGDCLECLIIRNYKGSVTPSMLTTGYHFPSLTVLELHNWENCADFGPIIRNLNNFEILQLSSGGNLVCRGKASLREVRIEDGQKVLSLHLPTSVEELYINGYLARDESLMKSLHGMNSLQRLSLVNSPNLTELLEKEVVISLLERSLQRSVREGHNPGFYVCFLENSESYWELQIGPYYRPSSYDVKVQYSGSGRWVWELLQHITSHLGRHIQELKFACFGGKIVEDGELEELFVPLTNLSKLKFNLCEQMLTLPTSINRLTSLKVLELDESPDFQSLPDSALPASLQKLKFSYCPCLQSLSWGVRELSSLQSLNLYKCPQLQCLANRTLPASLQELSISYCESFSSLPSDMEGLTSLHTLNLYNCPKIRSLADVGLPASLRQLSIAYCENLASLPSDMRALTSLQNFQLHYCPRLRSLPEYDLPATLSTLRIVGCPSLDKIYIKGPKRTSISHIPEVHWG